MDNNEKNKIENEQEIPTPDKNAEAEEIKPEKEAEQAASEEVSAEEQLKKDLDEAKNSLLSLAAEFDNYQKRSAREKEQLTAFVKADTVKKLLPVMDNIALASGCDAASPDYTKGLEMIVKQLKEILEKLGLCEIEAKGKPFDPTLHEAVIHIEDENYGENEVAEVLQSGYKLGDTVLRPAMVKVAN